MDEEKRLAIVVSDDMTERHWIVNGSRGLRHSLPGRVLHDDNHRLEGLGTVVLVNEDRRVPLQMEDNDLDLKQGGG